MAYNKLQLDRDFFVHCYVLYRDWLYTFLQDKFPTVVDLRERVNYYIVSAITEPAYLLLEDPAFELHLQQVPFVALRALAEQVFVGENAYRIVPYRITRDMAQRGPIPLPVPGFDLMHHQLTGQRLNYYGAQLSTAEGSGK
jgi:hypothetical protein